MLKFGQECNLSGSAQSSPNSGRKRWELIITPEIAVLQIQSILDLCLEENPTNISLELIKAEIDFQSNYPIIDGKVKGFFSFNELKDYILDVLIILVSQEPIANLKGGSSLPAKLKEAASSWPTQKQYLAQKKYMEQKIHNMNNALPNFKRELSLKKQLQQNLIAIENYVKGESQDILKLNANTFLPSQMKNAIATNNSIHLADEDTSKRPLKKKDI